MRSRDLEVITGNSFRDTYEKFDWDKAGSVEILSAADILKRGIASAEIRATPFYTGDGLVYFTHQGKPCLGHERRSISLIELGLSPQNLNQLERLGYYREYAEHNESETDGGRYYGIIDLSQLRLSSEGFGNPFLRVPLAGYDGFNPEERKLTERIYGTERVFHRIMEPLRQEGITETRIILPDPQEVLDTTKNGPFWKIGYLNGFYGNFQFDAANSELKKRGNLLGKRRK